MEQKQLLGNLKVGLTELYENDKELIKNRISERSLLANLKCYLQQNKVFFKKYSIDVEYNREGEGTDSKRDCNNNPTTADLIIHKRGDKNDGNLLYCEAKMWFNNNEEKISIDKETIKCFIEKFSYEYGIFIIFYEKYIEYTLFIKNNGDIEEKNNEKITFN